MTIGLEHEVVDSEAYERTVERFRVAAIRLPKISELVDPWEMSDDLRIDLGGVDPNARTGA